MQWKMLTVSSIDINRLTNLMISLGALIERSSANKLSGEVNERMGPGSLVNRESLFAKQVYSLRQVQLIGISIEAF